MADNSGSFSTATSFDVYIFHFQPPSTGEAFQGYMRDFAILTYLPDFLVSSSPTAGLNYGLEYLPQSSAALLYKMDEQYGGMIFDSSLLEVIALGSGFSHVSDSSGSGFSLFGNSIDKIAPVLCPESTIYNSITHLCDSMSPDCDYYDSAGACLSCRASIFQLASDSKSCTSNQHGAYRDYRQVLYCDLSCLECTGYKPTDCTHCMPPLYFSSGRCLCNAGLSPVYTESKRFPQCLAVCGDAMRYTTESCDDGNTNNYDGCSSSCIVESNFVCVGGSLTSPDTCYCDMDVTEAAFTNSWKQIELKFSTFVEIADGSSGTSAACEKFLPLTILGLLGQDYKCSSTSSNAIIIVLGEGASIDRYTKLSILEGGLKIPMVSCGNMEFSDISITPDPTLPSPTAVISAPSYVSLCENMRAYGGNSKANIESLPSLSYSWTVADIIPDFTDKDLAIRSLNNFIASKSYTDTLILYSSQLLPDKLYQLQLRVTNAAGMISTALANFTTSSEIKVTLDLVGPSYQAFYPWQHIVIRVQVDMTRCKSSESSKDYTVNDLTFSWSLAASTDKTKNSIGKISNTKANLTYLEIFPYILSPFCVYTFSVRASIPTALNISDTKQVQISILQGPLVAYILGQNRAVRPGEVFALDGGMSYDTSYSTEKQKTDTEFTYAWSCKYLDTNEKCRFKSGNTLESVAGTNKKILVNASDIDFAGDLEVTLKVAKELRSSTNTIVIKYSDTVGSASSPYILPPFITTDRGNPDSSIVLRAYMIADSNSSENSSDALQFKWSCTNGPCDQVEFISPNNYLATTVYLGKNILVNANNISSSALTFMLQVSGNNSSGYSNSSIKIPINSPPKYGTIQVTPTYGDALTTTFTLSADNWWDPDGDNPLRYEFLASEKEDFSDFFPLTDLILASEFSTILWKPLLVQSPAKLYLRVRVYDSLMAKSEATTSVEINSGIDPQKYLSFFADLTEIYNSLIVNNVERLLKDISILIKQSNEASEVKKSLELSSLHLSVNPLLKDCQLKCFNGGSCILSQNGTTYVCQCPANNSYSSNCLYSIDEFNAEVTFKTALLQKALYLSELQPWQPSVIKIKLNIFDEVLYDSSIITKAQKQYMIRNIINDLTCSISQKEVFDSDNTLALSQNFLYTQENLKTVVSIAEKMMRMDAEKMLSDESELTLEIIKMLNLAGKAILQNTLPGEDPKTVSGKNISLTVNRVPFEEILKNNTTIISDTSQNSLPTVQIINGTVLANQFINNGTAINTSIVLPSNVSVLQESRFGAKYGFDVVMISSGLNLANKVSNPLIINLANISNTSFNHLSADTLFIEFTLPIKSVMLDQEYIPKENYTCVFYQENITAGEDTTTDNDTSLSLYSEEGCQSRVSNDSITCACSHLTIFVLDIRAAKSAYGQAAKNVATPLLNTSQDMVKMLSSFPFILIAFLIALNVLSFWLYKLDQKDNSKDEYFTQKEEMTRVIFPDPSAKDAIDFCANGSSGKDELMSNIKQYLLCGIDSKRQLLNGPSAGKLDMNSPVQDLVNVPNPFKLTPQGKCGEQAVKSPAPFSQKTLNSSGSIQKLPSPALNMIPPSDNQSIKENPEEENSAGINNDKDKSFLDRSSVQLQPSGAPVNTPNSIRTPDK